MDPDNLNVDNVDPDTLKGKWAQINCEKRAKKVRESFTWKMTKVRALP